MTSEAISINNPHGNCEGQKLPAVRSMMFDIGADARWDENYNLDWNTIKDAWHEHWDVSKSVLLEKSPPNIVRVPEIKRVFDPCKFVIMYRNPYALCHSLMQRNDMTEYAAARFAVKCLDVQRRNIGMVNSKIAISYEDLLDPSSGWHLELNKLVPEIGQFKRNIRFTSKYHGRLNSKMANSNSEKIGALTRSQINRINDVFGEHDDLLKEFGYDLI